MTVTFHHTFNHTLLAYLLSLRDYSQSLTSKDKQNLDKFAKEFRLYPDDIESHIEPLLMEKIAENTQLNQLFQTYKNKLDNSGEIPSDFLPKLGNLLELETSFKNNFVRISKGDIPDIEDDTTPKGQELILHNSVILISESEEPEKVTDNLTWIDELKKWLG